MLSKALKERPTEVEAEYPIDGVEAFEEGTGFFVTLRYVGLHELERALDGQRKKHFKGGKVKDIVGGVSDALRQTVARAIITWRGLTKDVLKHMNLDLDFEALEGLPDEIPYSEESKVTLLRNDAEFARWVQDTATSIIEMRALEVADEAKNLPTSPVGMPEPGE